MPNKEHLIYRVVHRWTGKVVAVHQFSLGERPASYTATISCNAFRRNQNNQRVLGESEFDLIDSDHWQTELKFFPEVRAVVDAGNIQEHATIWDFYRAVGFDWKKKKWYNPKGAKHASN